MRMPPAAPCYIAQAMNKPHAIALLLLHPLAGALIAA